MLNNPTLYTAYTETTRMLSAYCTIGGVRVSTDDRLSDFKLNQKADKDGVWIGSVIPTELKMTLIKDGLTASLAIDTEIIFYHGVQVGGAMTYQKLGKYYIYSVESKEDSKTVTVLAYDRLKKAQETPMTGDAYPITVTSLLAKACALLGVSYTTTNLIFGSYSIPSEIYYGANKTVSDVIRAIAQANMTFATFDIDGRLVFRRVTETSKTIATENMFKWRLKGKQGPINAIVLSRQPQNDDVALRDEASITANGLNELKVINNPILDIAREGRVTAALNAVKGVSYTGVETLTMQANPLFEIGDYVTVEGEKTLILEHEITLTRSTIKCAIPLKTETDYSKAKGVDKQVVEANLTVDKLKGEIVAEVTRSKKAETDLTTELGKTNTQVTNQETRITQNEKDIKLKASQTSLQTLSDKVTGENGLEKRVNVVETSEFVLNATTQKQRLEKVVGDVGDSKSGLVKSVAELKTTAESITSTVTQMKADATNLVNDFSVTGVQDDGKGRTWTSSGSSNIYFLNYLANKGVLGKDTKAIVFDSSAWSQYKTQVFQIDPSKAYRFSAWMQSTKPTGQSAGADGFGLYLYDENGSVLTITPVWNANGTEGTPTSNAYFAESRTFGWGWKEYVAYIVPHGFDTSKLKGVGKNVSQHYIIPPNARKGVMRMVNAYDDVAPRSLVIAHPIVTEGDPDAIGTTADFQSIVEQTADRYRVKAANIDLEGLVSIVNTSTGDATRISGAGIRTGAIGAAHMTVDTAMVAKLTAGNLLADKIWTDRLSTNYLTSSFLKTRYGDVDTLKAVQGTIGGWEINQQSLSSASGGSFFTFNNVEYAKANGFNIIEAGSGSDMFFRVGNDGKITATGGTIGGFTFDGNTLFSGSGEDYVRIASKPGFDRIRVGGETWETATFAVSQKGSIKATAGTIGGWSLSETNIRSKKNSTGVQVDLHDGSQAGWKLINVTKNGNTIFGVDGNGGVSATSMTLVSPTGSDVSFTSGTYNGTGSGTWGGRGQLTSGYFNGGSFSSGSYSGNGYFNSGMTIGGKSIKSYGTGIEVSQLLATSTLQAYSLRSDVAYIYLGKYTCHITSGGAWNIVSDVRDKKDIEDVGKDEYVKDILSLPLIRYRLNTESSDEPLSLGINANYVAKTRSQKFVEAIMSTDPKTGHYRVNYSGLIPMLVLTVQQQQREIDELRRRK